MQARSDQVVLLVLLELNLLGFPISLYVVPGVLVRVYVHLSLSFWVGVAVVFVGHKSGLVWPRKAAVAEYVLAGDLSENGPLLGDLCELILFFMLCGRLGGLDFDQVIVPRLFVDSVGVLHDLRYLLVERVSFAEQFIYFLVLFLHKYIVHVNDAGFARGVVVVQRILVSVSLVLVFHLGGYSLDLLEQLDLLVEHFFPLVKQYVQEFHLFFLVHVVLHLRDESQNRF